MQHLALLTDLSFKQSGRNHARAVESQQWVRILIKQIKDLADLARGIDDNQRDISGVLRAIDRRRVCISPRRQTGPRSGCCGGIRSGSSDTPFRNAGASLVDSTTRLRGTRRVIGRLRRKSDLVETEDAMWIG